MEIDKKLVGRFWNKHPLICAILKESADPEIARNHIHNYLAEQWRVLYQSDSSEPTLQWGIRMLALRIFRRIISQRSEQLTGFSIVRLLFNLAHEQFDDLPKDLNIGFFEEIDHLLLAIADKSEIYENVPPPSFLKQHGRKAAIQRSKHLDEIAQQCSQYIQRYPHGLLGHVDASRLKNRDRILKNLNGKESDWNNYQWHLKNVIRDAKTLGKLIHLSRDETKAINLAKESKLPFGITPYYVSLMDKDSSRENDHAIRAQVIPSVEYVETMRQYRGNHEPATDFMLEKDTSPVDLITRRYPFIVILKPYNTCSQICVYCQRNWEIDDVLDKHALATPGKLEKALSWLEKTTDIREVLVTGGDPFIMANTQIESILCRLAGMSHITRIRFGTRTPVVLPQRITQDLVDLIAEYHVPGKREIAIVTHFEHCYEVTPQAMEAVQKCKRQGIGVYNQVVFTVENSRKFELVALRENLRLIGVDSYYTFNTKGKQETKRYRVPMARLQQEIKEEARLVPGLVRTDESVYNVPGLGKNYIRASQHHSLLTVLPNGRRIYEFHPWEKNLRLVDTYIDTDVSIHDYLTELKNRGENINDYKTIWYYY